MSSKTFVLVSGVCHGGWCWQRLTPLLQTAGHRVLTPTLTGLGERAHLLTPQVGLETFIRDILNVIDCEELQNVVLVGHSFAGFVISGVADRIPGPIHHLVYLDAAVPDNGDCAMDMLSPNVAQQRQQAARKHDGGISFPAPDPASFGLDRPADTRWLARRLCPHPLKSYTDKLSLMHPTGNNLPRTYIHCTKPAYPVAVAIAARIRTQAEWQYRELATGHEAMISAPEALAALLLECG